jgi:alpha-glucosidase
MQWSATPGCGFTEGRPWLAPVDPEIANVAEQADDPRSVLALYRDLIQLRARSPALRHGALRMIDGLPDGALAWTREARDESVLVAVNMGDGPCRLDLARLGRAAVRLAGTELAAPADGQVRLSPLELRPLEAVVARLGVL